MKLTPKGRYILLDKVKSEEEEEQTESELEAFESFAKTDEPSLDDTNVFVVVDVGDGGLATLKGKKVLVPTPTYHLVGEEEFITCLDTQIIGVLDD